MGFVKYIGLSRFVCSPDLLRAFLYKCWHPYLVEPMPEWYELIKYRNRNASTIKTCLAVHGQPHVRFV